MIKSVSLLAAAGVIIGGTALVSAQTPTAEYDIYRTRDGVQLNSQLRSIDGTDCFERVNRRGRQVWVLPPAGQDPSTCEQSAEPTTTTTTPLATTTHDDAARHHHDDDAARHHQHHPTTTTTTTTAPPPESTTTTTVSSPTTSPDFEPWDGPDMKIPGIDPSRASGRSSNELLRYYDGDFGGYSGTGEVRMTCGTSHHAYDDPIVAPGQTGASHLHTFFGNAGTDADSTYESLRNEPAGSTCAGGSVNKSAYWFPSLIDGSSKTVVEPTLAFVYYKTGYWGQDGRDIQDIPDGLRMISGNASGNGSDDLFVNWSCSNHGGDGVPLGTIRSGSSIPQCARNDLLVLRVTFPQCWNGRDLDSANHKSHMAHPNFQGQCPATHPVLLPQVQINVSWNMGAAGSNSLYVANDMMLPAGSPPGQGAHADFFEAWDPAARSSFVQACMNARRDCGTRQLGDGFSLIDP